ncbi:MAG: acetolactate synthase, partial [Candidatus Altiarchaeota archaeon]
MIKQISVFLANEPGSLKNVTELLKNANIDIRALTVAETGDYGVLRLILSDPDSGMDTLKKAGISAKENDVLGVQLTDQPGGLHQVAESVSADKLNIEYVYPFITKTPGKAVVILRTNDIQKAEKVLKGKGYKILEQEEIYDI